MIAGATAARNAMGQDGKAATNREPDKRMTRGAIVFHTYCTLCHAERGQGPGRAARLYADTNLTITDHPVDYYNKIIRHGGASVGRSAYMPPWQDELSEEQIGDVIAYLPILGESVHRGEVVYKTNCILCHGVNGDGKGRSARLMHPPPSDLTHSDKDDQYKTAIIRLGGTPVGRSAEMPPWGDQLSNDEILDLVEYLRAIVVTPPKH
jgi:cytochrome c oxidase cbb3-type subunit III